MTLDADTPSGGEGLSFIRRTSAGWGVSFGRPSGDPKMRGRIRVKGATHE